MNEVTPTLRAASFLVVRASCGRGAQELICHEPSSAVLGQRAHDLDYFGGEGFEPLGDVVAFHGAEYREASSRRLRLSLRTNWVLRMCWEVEWVGVVGGWRIVLSLLRDDAAREGYRSLALAQIGGHPQHRHQI